MLFLPWATLREASGDSPSSYDIYDSNLRDGDYTKIEAIANLDDNTATPSATANFGPLMIVETFGEETETRVGFYPHPRQVSMVVALYEGSRDVLSIAGIG
ncbi:hypothetical protein OPQ81_009003 [Rhizoctonia solani]|nr:hypothetical protein OPQ81_009003 [Rhizoctonia solani]